jgi:hypothetical protein
MHELAHIFWAGGAFGIAVCALVYTFWPEDDDEGGYQ